MKKRAPKGWVKISEFEKLVGISSKTISDAIRDGRIPPAYVVKVGEKTTTAVYYIDPQNAASAWLAKVNVNRPLSRSIYDALSQFIRGDSKREQPKPNKITLADAQLMERIAKARLAELDCKEREGELVAKADIDAALFAAGQELRNALLAIPDRVIDTIMAADTRTKGHRILFEAIAAELERLSEINLK